MPISQSHVERRIAKLRGWLAYLEQHVWSELEAESLAHGDYGRVSGFGEPVKRTGTCGWCGGKGCARCKHGRVTYYDRDGYDSNPQPIPQTNGHERGVDGRRDDEHERQLDQRDLKEIAELADALSGEIRALESVGFSGIQDYEAREDKNLRLVRIHAQLLGDERAFLERLERALADVNGHPDPLRFLAENLLGSIPRPPRQFRESL